MSAPLTLSSAPGRWVLLATILGSALAGIDATVVNVALPALGESLDAEFSALQWTVSAYALTLASFILLGGTLGDRFGRRRVFGIGLGIFTIASLAAGLAQIGRLPLLGALELAHGGPTGAPGGNSALRLAGVWERLVVGPDLRAALDGLDGPVLLVDDLVSSRWTLTVAGRALRRAGAPGVLPFVLAVDG